MLGTIDNPAWIALGGITKSGQTCLYFRIIQNRFVSPLPTVGLNVSETLQGDIIIKTGGCQICNKNKKFYYKINDIPSDENLIFLWDKLLCKNEHNIGIFCVENEKSNFEMNKNVLATFNKFTNGLKHNKNEIIYKLPIIIVATKTDVLENSTDIDYRKSLKELSLKANNSTFGENEIEIATTSKDSSALDKSPVADYRSDYELLKSLGILDSTGCVNAGYRLMVTPEIILQSGEKVITINETIAPAPKSPIPLNKENENENEKVIIPENNSNIDKTASNMNDVSTDSRLVTIIRLSSKTGYNIKSLIPTVYTILAKEKLILEKNDKKIHIPFGF